MAAKSAILEFLNIAAFARQWRTLRCASAFASRTGNNLTMRGLALLLALTAPALTQAPPPEPPHPKEWTFYLQTLPYQQLTTSEITL